MKLRSVPPTFWGKCQEIEKCSNKKGLFLEVVLWRLTSENAGRMR